MTRKRACDETVVVADVVLDDGHETMQSSACRYRLIRGRVGGLVMVSSGEANLTRSRMK